MKQRLSCGQPAKRFAFCVGKRCRTSTIKDVATELHLDWKTVKELEKQYRREQLRRAGTPRPKVIGKCRSANSVGFVDGLNNKVRVIQRRTYGLRDEEYLKILTSMLPDLL